MVLLEPLAKYSISRSGDRNGQLSWEILALDTNSNQPFHKERHLREYHSDDYDLRLGFRVRIWLLDWVRPNGCEHNRTVTINRRKRQWGISSTNEGLKLLRSDRISHLEHWCDKFGRSNYRCESIMVLCRIRHSLGFYVHDRCDRLSCILSQSNDDSRHLDCALRLTGSMVLFPQPSLASSRLRSW